MTVLLREGYNLSFAPLLNETTTRAAWTHMLMQSPYGEIPTGGRSSQHTWNEGVSALAYEIFATQYAAKGDAQAACMFQRAAHLAHSSIKRWVNTQQGGVYIVKNRFNPEERVGFEDYSYISNYQLLPAAMLSAAYMYADKNDAIPECSAPADVGGFVITLPEHHLVIANAGGVYAEIETAADPNYDPTGLHRVHINTCGTGMPGSCVKADPLITVTAAPPFFTGAGTGMAIGPWWSTAADPVGSRTSFAGLNYTDIAGISVSPVWSTNATTVAFGIEYYLLVSGGIVTQDYLVTVNPDGSKPVVSVVSAVELLGGDAVVARAAAKGVKLDKEHVARATALGVFDPAWTSSPAATLTRFGTQFPVFLFDGQTNTTVTLDASQYQLSVSAATPSAGWGTAVFSNAPPQPGHNQTLTYDATDAQTLSRNGPMISAWAETSFDTGAPSMTQFITATN
jgi:hypothetical protein